MTDVPSYQEQAATAAKREYMRQWRKANPDKVQAAQARYWQRKGEQMNSMDKAAEIRNQEPAAAANGDQRTGN